jgi:hypothetical protein
MLTAVTSHAPLLPPARPRPTSIDVFLDVIEALCERALAARDHIGCGCALCLTRAPRPSAWQSPHLNTDDNCGCGRCQAVQTIPVSPSEERLTQARAKAGQAPRNHPLGVLIAELGLPPAAARVLLAVAAPALRPSLATAYESLSGTGCDETLVQTLLGFDGVSAQAVSAWTGPASPLVVLGAVRVSAAGVLTADPVVVARLCRADPLALVPSVQVRWPTLSLEELMIPGADTLAERLASAAPRVTVRGPAGSGRRTLLAALAAKAGRGLGVIEGGRLSPEELRVAVQQTYLAGLLPCVAGLDVRMQHPRSSQVLRALLRSVPCPLALCLGEGTPVDPDHAVLDLEAVTLSPGLPE